MGESCFTTAMCLSGLYCNGTQCVDQLNENEKCDDTFECGNNLACYNSTCTAYASVQTGGDMSQEILGTFFYSPMKGLLCEYGNVDEKNNTCSQWDYAGQTANNTNADGYVKCDWGSQCSYTDGSNMITQDCGCGYNADGQGYCPLAQTQSTQSWKNAVTTQAKGYNNKCHSMNRFTCYLKQETSLTNDLHYYRHRTVDAHLYYKAVSCAETVLASSYLKYSFFAFLSVLAILF